MHFRSPREYVDQPQALVDALRRHDVNLNMEGPLVGIGDIDLMPFGVTERGGQREHFRLSLLSHRFVGNLRVDHVDGQPLLRSSPLLIRLDEVFGELGMVQVASPINAELDYVQSEYGDRQQIAELIVLAREHHGRVEHAVASQEFESAARHRDARDASLHELFETCRAWADHE